jgi:hypothetical protein
MGTAPSQPVILAGTKPATLAISFGEALANALRVVTIVPGSISDPSSPCFLYEDVVAALAPVFNSAFSSALNSTPLYFSEGVPFQLASLIMLTKPGGWGGDAQWDNDRNYPLGPVVTLSNFWGNKRKCDDYNEMNFFVKDDSKIAPKFSFEKYTPPQAGTATEEEKSGLQLAGGGYKVIPAGKSVILLKVTQPGRHPQKDKGKTGDDAACSEDRAGYVMFKSEDNNRPRGATIVPKAEVLAAQGHFGLVYATDSFGKVSTTLLYAGAGDPVSIVSVIPTNNYYGKQEAAGDTPYENARFVYFGLFRDRTEDTGPAPTPRPYNWTYRSDMGLNVGPSWSQNLQLCFQFEMKYLVTTEGMEAYMGTYCSGTTTACTNTQDAPSCTMFMATGALGDTCRTAALLNVAASEHVKQNICGIDWRNKSVFAKPPRAQDVEALKTPDCACINYEQSTFKQKTLANLDFAGYSEWMTRNGITPIASSGYCWWPSCTNAGSALKAPSLTPPISECPDVTQCINSINQAAVSENSTLTINTKNSCGGSGSGGGGNSGTGEGTQGSSTGGTETTTGGETTTTYNEPPLTPSTSGAGAAGGGNDGITSQKWFYPVVISVAVLVVLALAWYFMHNKNKKPAA